VGALDTPIGSLAYTPGRGLRAGDIGLTVGGFTNLVGQHEEHVGGEFAIDTLNFFLIHDYFARFRTVAELQLDDLFAADQERTGTHDFAFDVRRLFGDLTVSDLLHVRAGTDLTPVGRWNLILTAPLTWTTEPPLIVEETFFDPTTTGVLLHGSAPTGDGRLSYTLFSQFLAPLEDNPDIDPADHTAGARLEYALGPGRALGATYLATDRDGEWSHLGGLHVLWQQGRIELLGEVLYQEGSGLLVADEEDVEPEPDDEEDGEDEDEEEEDDEEEAGGRVVSRAARLAPHASSQWGAYLQGVVNVSGPFYLVGRYEYFDPPHAAAPLHLFTPGAVYKPWPFMALKVEYRFTDRRDADNPQGVFGSFTTLF
jgi:hypothetical protein